MNTKATYNPFRWKSTKKYQDWDKWKCEWQGRSKLAHRMERHLAKQSLNGELVDQPRQAGK